MTRQNFVRLRRCVIKGSKYPSPEQYFAPRTSIETRASSKLQIKDPELDLLTIDAFKTKYAEALKHNPQLLSRLPFLELKKLDGTSKRGLLIYAEHWNPPPGCLRIVSLDEYSADRVNYITDSDSVTYGNEIADQWNKTLRENKSLGTTMAKSAPKSKTDTFELPSDVWADKKKGIFASFIALTTAVASVDTFRRQKDSEKAEAARAKADATTDQSVDAPPSNFFVGSTGAQAPSVVPAHATPDAMRSEVFDAGMQPPSLNNYGHAVKEAKAKVQSAASGHGRAKAARSSHDETAGETARHAGVSVPSEPSLSSAELQMLIQDRLSDIGTLDGLTKGPGDAYTLLAELAFDLASSARCDMVKEGKVDGLTKKTAQARKHHRSKAAVIDALDRIDDVAPQIKVLIQQNQNAIRIEKAAKQNAQRRASIATCFDMPEAACATRACLLFQMGLPISRTILFRFHALGIEHCFKERALETMSDMMSTTTPFAEDATMRVCGGLPSMLTQMRECLSLRAFVDRNAATDMACHWQQKLDVESVLSSLVLTKADQRDMEHVIIALPYRECHEDAQMQIDVYHALANPEKAGEAKCKETLSILRVNTSNSLFHIRYQKYGQELKAACTAWCERQMSSSLSQQRLKRLEDTAQTAYDNMQFGMNFISQWATTKQQIDEFTSSCPTGSSEHIDCAVRLLTMHVKVCMSEHQKKFDDLMGAAGVTIVDGKLTCEVDRAKAAKTAYQTVTLTSAFCCNL